ncbi:MAG: UDP-3-O-(3-hydroxymyristoyl)glucosamine N-acyltransferase [Desulfobacterales bacterium]
MRPAKETKGISLGSITKAVDGKMRGDVQKIIRGAAPFETATPDDITFVEHKRLLKRINDTQAGAIIVPADFEASNQNIVQVDHPKLAFAKVMKLLVPASEPHWGTCANTDIGHNFVSGPSVSIGPSVVIGDDVCIGDRVILHAGVVIGRHVQIGDEVEIFPNVCVLDGCRIGNRVTIHAGSVIGSDGFGFAPDGDKYFKIPQLGIVQIDDDVEIGAGNTIDRATFGKTWIKSGVKTDNMVHIAHNVIVGENTLLVAQVGISGSVTIGKHAILAGQVGVSQHLEIGDNAIIGPQAGLMRSVSSGEIISGTPGISHKLNRRVTAVTLKLPELNKKISAFEKRIGQLEEERGES